MAVWKFINHAGVKFSRNPRPVKSHSGKGWFVKCNSDNRDLYNGNYVCNVGAADEVKTGVIAFRLKRDAVAAIEAGRKLGLFLEA